jgi:hypothetical protein
MPVVISDTSPLRALAHLGHMQWLQELFHQIRLPPAVASELRHPPSALAAVDITGWHFLVIQSPSNVQRARNGVGSHSLGESGLSGYGSVMPRRPRIATRGYVYHALNRAVGRSTIFEKVDDYAAFEAVLEEAREQVDMRLLAFCVMPNQAVQVVSDSGRRALRACGTESTGAQP